VASAPRLPARRSLTTSSNRSIGKRLKVGYGARFNLSTAPPTQGNWGLQSMQKDSRQTESSGSESAAEWDSLRRLDTPRTASRERFPLLMNRGGPSRGDVMEGCTYQLNVAPGGICFLGEIAQEFKEIRRLTTEQAVVGEGFYRSFCDSGRSRWPNDRADREFLA
jgi:hypothetical protein